MNIHWKDWCWSWNSNTLATWLEQLTHLKSPWCWERLKAGGERDDRGWDGRMASLIQWAWVWVSSRSWWWIGRPGVLQSMGSQRWTRLSNWSEHIVWIIAWITKVMASRKLTNLMFLCLTATKTNKTQLRPKLHLICHISARHNNT